MSIAVALTIAGSDPSGGAGIQADLKTFHSFGVYGTSVIALRTVQDTRGIREIRAEDPAFVGAQLDCLLEDLPPDAVKTGALGSRGIVRAVAARVRDLDLNLVMDPVLAGSGGTALLAQEGVGALRDELLPLALLVTPNLAEASILAGIGVRDLRGMREAARRIARLGPRAVLVKGGHLPGEPMDVLLDGEGLLELPGGRVATRHTHGSGCTLSAAITAGLAAGRGLREAVAAAKGFVERAIASAPGLGRGHGPLDHRVRPG